jgi:antitoxin PrlF
MREPKRSAYSRLGADSRVTLPRAVREHLGLRAGDSLRFVIDAAGVSIARVALRPDACFATFTEWTSEQDDEAYSDL